MNICNINKLWPSSESIYSTKNLQKLKLYKYSRTSMGVDESARSGDIIRICLIFYNMKVCCVFSLESPQRGENTQYTVFNIKKENHTKLLQICSQGSVFLGTEE